MHEGWCARAKNAESALCLPVSPTSPNISLYLSRGARARRTLRARCAARGASQLSGGTPRTRNRTHTRTLTRTLTLTLTLTLILTLTFTLTLILTFTLTQTQTQTLTLTPAP